MNLSKTVQLACRRSGRFMRRSAPTILTFIGAAGVVATAVLAVRATPKAMELIEKENRERADNGEEPAKGAELVALTWQGYIPAAVTGAATIACIFGANVLNRRQQATLASAYALVSSQFREYRDKLKELYGQEAHEKIMSAIVTEKPKPVHIYEGNFGKSMDFGDETDEEPRLFYDAFSERYFQSTFSRVMAAEYHLNRNFALNWGEVPVEQFYEFLGLDTPEELKPLWWFVSDYYTWIDFTHSRAMIDDGPDGEVECWVIEMEFPPTPQPLEYDT